MAQTVGEIGLDLVINQKQYNKQLNAISGMAKKAGTMLVAAFSVKKLVNFGKECLELGSNLSEVQNVVDVTFPNMKSKVDEFAKSTASSFGLSKTMAKKYTGTFGAMAKAFKFSESQAFEMGKTLTGLAGDVASFYNITQDEAYTKLKSVFTGETESLKDLGVVMTQSALDSYAMANGYGKVTAKMTEAEKVALRYAFVQDQLSAATGDFARTSDSWANQVRILNLQFDSLKATIGQGLINVFTPVIKLINTAIGRIATLANAFKAFTELLTGNKSDGSQLSNAGTEAEKSLSSAAGAANNLEESTAGAGNAAKKAAKDMKALMGFDKINKIGDASDSGSDASGGISGDAIDFGSLADGESVLDKTETSCNKLTERLKELFEICKTGFTISFDDSDKNIEKIKGSLSSIKQSLADIFTSPEVSNSAEKWANSVALNVGKIVGSVAGVGTAIVTNLTSGISKSLEEKKGFIQEKISSLFSINADVWSLKGDLASSLGNIISGALTSDSAIDISSDVFSILTTGVLGGAELFSQAGLDLSSCIIQPFIDNEDGISEAVTNTLSPISTVVDTLKTGIEDAFASIKKSYDEHVAPTLNKMKQGISDSFGKVLESYNKYIAPVLDRLSKKFEETYEGHIKPCIDKISALFGRLAEYVGVFYEQKIKPLFDWCVKYLVPVLAPIFELLGEKIMSVFATIGDVIGGLAESLTGIIDFISGVFTGDWEKAWNGVVSVFSGIFNALTGIIKNPINNIISALNKLISGLNKVKFDIPEWVPVIGGKKFGGFNIPKIPKLAEGGYVKPNTPQLAMIGDNRHQGEVVSPEDKLREMAIQAVKMAGGTGITKDELERIINNAVIRIVSSLYELGFNIDGEQIAKAEKVVKQSMDRRFNTVEVV